MKRKNQRNANTASGPHLRFANLLAESGITGAELARRADVATSTVSHWKTGKHDVPGIVLAYLELLAAVRRIAK